MKKIMILVLCALTAALSIGCSEIVTDFHGGEGKESVAADPSGMPDGTVEYDSSVKTGEEVDGASVSYDTAHNGKAVEVKPQSGPAFGCTFVLPDGWRYEEKQTGDEPTTTTEVSIIKDGREYPALLIICSGSGLGVCGTGLEQKDIVFNGCEASQGFYNEQPVWNFIVLKGEYEGCSIINQAVDSYDDYDGEIENILSTVRFVRYE